MRRSAGAANPNRREHISDDGPDSGQCELSIDDWLNLGFVKIASQTGFYVCERTKKNRYGRAVL